MLLLWVLTPHGLAGRYQRFNPADGDSILLPNEEQPHHLRCKIKLPTMLFSESSGSKILVSSRGKTAYIGPPNFNWL